MSYSVDVFDVGAKQLTAFCDGRFYDNTVADGDFRPGCYVVAHTAIAFGKLIYCSLSLVTATFGYAYDWAVSATALSFERAEYTTILDEYEVWYVRDDEELWGGWQRRVDEVKDFEESLRQLRMAGELSSCGYKIMDGSQCVACVDHVPTNVYVIAGMLGGDNCTYEHYVTADDFGEALAMCEINGAYIVRCGVSYVGDADCSITVRDALTDDDVDAGVTVLTVWVWAAGETC